MFLTKMSFEPIAPTTVQRVLAEVGWTDVLEIRIDGNPVYRDMVGVANDVAAAFATIWPLLHEHNASYTAILGREVGSWHQINRVHSTRLFVSWEVLSRDRTLDAGASETWPLHRERVVADVGEGGLQNRQAWLDRALSADVEQAMALGLRPREMRPLETYFEAGIDRCSPFAEWFEAYDGELPPAETEHAVLAGMAEVA